MVCALTEGHTCNLGLRMTLLARATALFLVGLAEVLLLFRSDC